MDNFLNIHLQKNIIELKRCKIICLISDFTNNKRAIYKFGIFDFLFFKISDIGLL